MRSFAALALIFAAVGCRDSRCSAANCQVFSRCWALNAQPNFSVCAKTPPSTTAFVDSCVTACEAQHVGELVDCLAGQIKTRDGGVLCPSNPTSLCDAPKYTESACVDVCDQHRSQCERGCDAGATCLNCAGQCALEWTTCHDGCLQL